MKIIAWTLGLLLAIVTTFGIVQYVASERVEVVVLHTLQASGEAQQTRLWIVDHGGRQYLRAGSPAAVWYGHIRENPNIAVLRNEELRQYLAVPRRDKRVIVNRLMREKYTWGDQFISMMIDRDQAIPIALHPANK